MLKNASQFSILFDVALSVAVLKPNWLTLHYAKRPDEYLAMAVGKSTNPRINELTKSTNEQRITKPYNINDIQYFTACASCNVPLWRGLGEELLK